MTRPKEKLLADIMVLVFRLNGRLLEQGDRLVGELGLTSARWQVLGALALAGRPLTAPQIAAAMGITRQGTQKQLNLLIDEGLLQRCHNPSHERSSLYILTDTGKHAFVEADRLCDLWAGDLGQVFSEVMLITAKDVLGELMNRLDRPLPRHAQVG
ncbi:MarR family winged helix-turn-helix transcriptional regulator [Magnetospirillum molischianum]|uniref:Similar to transcriptional regulator n=1 Tax=Magnetospirillum molischianum DSM 120 TaxID=1150626 RepID=H8FQ55_MAGML|nr:helix-turn-helix domain-containing protein [Magnetospirillum molischianum]CCG40493.1 Similar to transcriptional regulator [Magnetospirillum molischianum DSM 120]